MTISGSERRKKILYYSVHEVLEYDDLRILKNAGYDVLSTGSFFSPNARSNRFRISSDDFFLEEEYNNAVNKRGLWHDDQGQLCVSREFARGFDASIINHDPDMIIRNIDALAQRPIIYRSLGQATLAIEVHLRQVADKLIVCRYDEREAGVGYLPTDAVIRFGKYHTDFPRWSGDGDHLLTFMNNIRRITARPVYHEVVEIVGDRNFKIFGMQNEGLKNAHGIASPAMQMQMYKDCNAYVFVNSLVASYTLNFIEALMVGVPMIAPSAARTVSPPQADWWEGRYAVEEILAGGAGLVYDTVDEAKELLADLKSRDLKAMSKLARRRALELFDGAGAEKDWHHLIEKYT